MPNTWYDIYLKCGHPVRWNEFQAVPKKGGKKWCRACNDQVEIAEVERHILVSDDEEEVEYG